MVAKSMVFREIGTVIASVHSTEPPTDAVWGTYIAACRRMLAYERIGALAVTAGGAPNSKQRRDLHGLVGNGPVLAAVVSDAALVRAAVTATAWFNPGIRCFALNRGAGLHDALKYLRVDGFVAQRVLVEVAAMQREVAA